MVSTVKHEDKESKVKEKTARTKKEVDLPTIGNRYQSFKKRLRKIKELKLPPFTTGFTKFDKKMRGFKGVAILGGEPGVGKTSWALQFANQIAQLNRIPVCFVSIEIDSDNIMTKVMSRHTGIEHSEIESGKILEKENSACLKAVESVLKSFEDIFVIFDQNNDISIDNIVKSIKKLKTKLKSDRALVVIDCIQELCAIRYPLANDSFQYKLAIDRLLMEIRAASMKENFDALLISHLTKRHMDKNRQFGFSGSGGIDYKADITMILDNADKNKATFPHKKQKNIPRVSRVDKAKAAERMSTLHVLKNRYGPRFNQNFRYKDSISYFEEV